MLYYFSVMKVVLLFVFFFNYVIRDSCAGLPVVGSLCCLSLMLVLILLLFSVSLLGLLMHSANGNNI